MKDNEQHKGFPSQEQWARQIGNELAGDISEIVVSMGVKKFYPLEPGNGILGGLGFKYSRRLVKNKSNLVRIYALENGKRRMEWSLCLPMQDIMTLEVEDNVAPEEMERVWWEHTACAIRIPWMIEACKVKFRLGEVFITQGVNHAFSPEEIRRCIKRHVEGDWGNVCPEDREQNERGLDKEDPGRLMSVYPFEDGRILWVITEWDRSATTALLPEEY